MHTLGVVGLIAVLSACGSNHAPVTQGNSKGPAPAGYYRVQPGDNLYRIGMRHGMTVTALQRLNTLSNPSKLEVGQLIKVKGNAKAAPTTTKRATTTTAASKPATGALSTSIKLQWPVQGQVIARYDGAANKGIDIAGNLGTPIKAAAAGTVIYVGEEVRGYGKLVMIRHDARTLTAYAHNDSTSVALNQRVSAGQQIATMGSTGTNRVKSHFELRIQGKAVNPMPYLK
ncbi:MAG: peptidoglycan DD-metalloendopeptidase family protein [Neisseriaceae bacterium]|nr:peptidoglycan DD-metalloendopeptidase family protein [Neisseriaceae bacterium]